MTKRQLKAAGYKEKRVLTPEDLTKALKEVSAQPTEATTDLTLAPACTFL